MKISVHNSHYYPGLGLAVIQLRVRHLFGTDYESHRGRPGDWWGGAAPTTHRKRLRILNREYKRLERDDKSNHHE